MLYMAYFINSRRTILVAHDAVTKCQLSINDLILGGTTIMLIKVRQNYGLVKEFSRAGYYETEYLQRLFKDVIAAIHAGKMIGITGVIGCGKTIMLRQLQAALRKEGKIGVCQSLSIDKSRTNLSSLITALFYDLSSNPQVKIPSVKEKRERQLRELFRKGKKPVALFVDEAHDLHNSTLTGLKRLMEVVKDDGGSLSIILGGHPKLKNNLRRSAMEEIGNRIAIFSLDNIGGYQRKYIQWLLGECVAKDISVSELIVPEAIDLLAQKLRTPLQIQQHLSLAFEEGYRLGEKPVTTSVAESILPNSIDDSEFI